MKDKGIVPECSSSRQSRVYHNLLQYYKDLTKYCQYYPNYPRIGGRSSAIYCPVFSEISEKEEKIYYVAIAQEWEIMNFMEFISLIRVLKIILIDN